MTVTYPHALLLWCHSGSARVRTTGVDFHLTAGEVLFAAGSSTVTDRGLVIPIAFPNLKIDGHSRKVHVGRDWSDFMVYEFSRSLGHLKGNRTLSPEIARLFADPAAPPRMPDAPEARSVAADLEANPADLTSLEDFAARHDVSGRTLQRQFLSSTSLTFSEWRTAYRVSVAAELLARDFSVAVVANLVGFAATSSLTRAFRRHTGCTPSAYTPGTVGMGAPGKAPAIPASTTWHRTKNEDIILWIYRGTATLTTTGYCRFLGTGDVATIPAQSNTRLDIAAGSVALPLGWGSDIDEQPSLAQVVSRYRTAIGIVTGDPSTGDNIFGFTRKMGRARDMLKTGLRPKEVSRAIGYRTTSAFSRAFKGMHGMSPRDFQNHAFQEANSH